MTGTNVALVFDGDDTLWSTETLYDEARQEARGLVESSGLSGEEWETRQRSQDLLNFEIFGYSPNRFPTSCVQAYEALCQRHEVSPQPKLVADLRATASKVFARQAPPIPQAQHVLEELRARGARIALLTKGDREVQEARIAASGLGRMFDALEIVETAKSEPVFSRLLARLRAAPSAAWMVGNSLRSDALPALAAGLNAIWIDAHVWEHERSHDHLFDNRIIRAGSLEEVPAIVLGDHSTFQRSSGTRR